MSKKPKLLAIVGPTATGKSDLAVELAHQFNDLPAQAGEVVSADSRQVYRGLDIGTGKITEEEKRGIPHHLLDIADPSEQITVTDYKERAQKVIAGIHNKRVTLRKGDTLPILVGGTGFYIQAVVDNIDFPEVPPDEVLRAELEQKDTMELFEELKAKDPDRAATIQPDNKRRLIRALEIVKHHGKVPKIGTRESPYDLLMIGLFLDRDDLREKIQTRLKKRLNAGMIEEAQQLHENGLSYERMDELGLEYRFLAQYLQENISRNELEEQLANAIWQYAKRQLTWFRRDERIKWFKPDDVSKIIERVRAFV